MEWRSTFPTVSLLMLMLMSALTGNQAQAQHVFDIKDFGAVADGKTDYSKLAGPCNGAIEFQIKGGLRAFDSPQLSIDHWITFRYIDNLTITGGGSLDGQGAASWPDNDGSKSPNCKALPEQELPLQSFLLQRMTLEHVTATAPDESPNTDGIHMALSSNIIVRDSVISTGDNSISLGPGSKNIEMTGIACQPGQGISVGSLWGTPDEAPVITVSVRNCTFTDTQNGLRIKTRAPSYQGAVSDITFQDIIVNNVDSPIIIDQQYCPSNECHQKSSQVRISFIRFRNIRGTSSSSVIININCSPAVPCTGIELRDIDLRYDGKDGEAPSVCSNAEGASYGKQKPPSCLKSTLHNI